MHIGDALQRSDMSMTGVAVTVIGSSSVLQAPAGSRAAEPAAPKAAVLVLITTAGTARTRVLRVWPAMWQRPRLLLMSSTTAAKHPALQVQRGRMQRACCHCSALLHEHI